MVLLSAAVLCSSARAHGGVDGHVRICWDEVTVLRCKRLLPRAKGWRYLWGGVIRKMSWWFDAANSSNASSSKIRKPKKKFAEGRCTCHCFWRSSLLVLNLMVDLCFWIWSGIVPHWNPPMTRCRWRERMRDVWNSLLTVLRLIIKITAVKWNTASWNHRRKKKITWHVVRGVCISEFRTVNHL